MRRIIINGWIIIGVLVLLAGNLSPFPPLCSAQSGKSESLEKNDNRIGNAKGGDFPKVQEGDLVKVEYTATLGNGALVYSTREKAVRNPDTKKANGYLETTNFSPEELIAGKQGKIPGVGQSVLGMTLGEIKKITVPPESAYGLPDQEKRRKFASVKRIPQRIHLSPKDYVERFGAFPIQGQEVPLFPYFKAQVTEVKENEVLLTLNARDGERFEEEFGTTEVRVRGEEVVVVLNPKIGALFQAQNAEGRIIEADSTSFTVDFNPPLVGKSVVLEIEVISLTSSGALADRQISWIENHDQGLVTARKESKPAVLVLYADWCSWSKKLFNESFEDPRIRSLKDRLVWIKVNSDKQTEYAKQYQQNGFPMILLLQADGKIARKIDGYADGTALREAIGGLLEKPTPKES